MKIEFTKGLGFSGAHFIIGHRKCERLHGHNWRVGVTVEGEPDERGLVVDFLELKRFLGRLCSGYDHHLLLPSKNKSLNHSAKGTSTCLTVHGREFRFPSEDVVWLPVVNITVEELARVIADEVVKNLSSHPNVRRITVWVEESPGQGAAEERQIKACISNSINKFIKFHLLACISPRLRQPQPPNDPVRLPQSTERQDPQHTDHGNRNDQHYDCRDQEQEQQDLYHWLKHLTAPCIVGTPWGPQPLGFVFKRG